MKVFLRHAIRASFVLVALVPVLFACRQEAQLATERVSGTIDQHGGTISLTDGSYIQFEAGFLATPAKVILSSMLSNDLRGNDEAMKPLGLRTSIEIPYEAIISAGLFEERKHLLVNLSSLPEGYKESAELLVEVRVRLADGSEFFYFESRRPSHVEAAAADDAESDIIRLNNLQLKSYGPAVSDNVIITLQTLVSGQLLPQALPSGFALEDVVTGLNKGVVFDFAPDGRIFIGEKGGMVRVFRNGSLRSTPFIDISAQVNNLHDRGMLGLAVHPQFPSQPYVYLLFTYDPPETQSRTGYAGPDGAGARVSRLIRVTADAARNYNVALPGSEVVLLGTNSTWANIGNPGARNGVPSCVRDGVYVRDCLPIDEWSHTIGSVRFGTDGSLFVSNGDGAAYNTTQPYATRALELNSLAGKLLRIDPMTGRGYSTNPFYNGDLNSNRSKVYSLGLRNPFRFTVRPSSNEPFIGDVGWGTWEEINTGRGVNFGWPCYEGGSGTNSQQGSYRALAYCGTLYNDVSAGRKTITPALYAYSRADGGGSSSIQAGSFYTGTSYPSEYRNALFVVDYNRKWIRYLTLDNQNRFRQIRDFASGLEGIVQIAAGPDSDLYLMSIWPSKLMRLRYTANNQPPIAQASANPTQGPVPLTVAFSSSGSSDPDGHPLSYAWRFGDGNTSSQPNPSHTYSTRGVYRAVLTVTDSLGASGTSSVEIAVANSRPTARIAAPANGARFNVGNVVNYSGSGSDPEDGTLSGSRLSWELILHHNEHQHFNGLPPTTGTSGSFTAPNHGDNTHLELCLTATDSAGLKDRTCVLLYFNSVRYTLDTVPSGLELPWEGVLRKTPFTVNTYVNATREVLAPERQGSYAFTRWSDGGARIHTTTIANTAQTLVATYTWSFALSAALNTATGSVNLSWLGARSTQLDIYRNGSRIARNVSVNADGSGSYTDSLRQRGTYTYRVCRARRTTPCSTNASVTY